MIPLAVKAGKANARKGRWLSTRDSPSSASRQSTLPCLCALILTVRSTGSSFNAGSSRSQFHARCRAREQFQFRKRQKCNSSISAFWSIPTCWQPQTSPDLLHKTPFRFGPFLEFLDSMLMFPSASHFSGAHHFVSNGGTFNNILNNYVFVSESSDAG